MAIGFKSRPGGVRQHSPAAHQRAAMAQLAAANWRDTTCAGVLAFLISMWITNFFFRMRRDGVWFHDRGWPTDPLNLPVGGPGEKGEPRPELNEHCRNGHGKEFYFVPTHSLMKRARFFISIFCCSARLVHSRIFCAFSCGIIFSGAVAFIGPALTQRAQITPHRKITACAQLDFAGVNLIN